MEVLSASEGEANKVPFSVTLLSPQSGITVTSDNGNVILDWANSSDVDDDNVTHTVFADTVDVNKKSLEAWRNISENCMTIVFETGKIYFWRVETSNGVNTAISPTYTFKAAE